MEEIKTEEVQKELNPAVVTDNTQELDWEQKYKKLQSDTERGVQQLTTKYKGADTKAIFLEQVLEESSKVAGNQQHLINLYYEKPEVAKEILNRYYAGWSIDDYKTQLGLNDDYATNIDYLAEKKMQEMIKQNHIQSTIDTFVANMNYTDDEKTAFKEELIDIQDKLNDNNLSKNLEKIHLYLKRDEIKQQKKLDQQEIIARTSASSGGNGGAEKTSKPNATKSIVSEMLSRRQ